MKKGLCFATLIAVGAVGGARVASASPLLIDLSAARLAKGLFQRPEGNQTPTSPGPTGLGSNSGPQGLGDSGHEGLFVSDGDAAPVSLNEILTKDPVSLLDDSNLSDPYGPSSFDENESLGSDGPQQNSPLPQQFNDAGDEEEVTAVPEPVSALLLVTGLAGLVVVRKRSL